MVFTTCERCEPHVEIIVCEVLAIHQLVHCARIIAIVRQNIYVGRACADLRDFYWLSLLVKNLNACQAEIIHITPSFQNVKFENLPRW